MHTIVDLSENKDALYKALKTFNSNVPKKTIYAYGVSESNESFSAIMLFSRIELEECFQWQMHYYSRSWNISQVGELWENFVAKHHVASCLTELSLKGNESFSSLGFKSFERSGYEDRRWELYFPFGIVYKITDLNTGQFYIGETTSQKSWNKGYMGSGKKWKII